MRIVLNTTAVMNRHFSNLIEDMQNSIGFSLIFDGTTYSGEIVAMLLKYWSIHGTLQCKVCLFVLFSIAYSQAIALFHSNEVLNQRTMAAQLCKALFRINLDSSKILQVTHDECAVCLFESCFLLILNI